MTTTTENKSRLGAVRSGRQGGAKRFCFYGPESVGKTTLAAHAPNPIFIDIEDGSADLNVARYVFPGDSVVPRTYQEVLDAIQDLILNEHDFKSIVIDSLDRLEALIWAHCIKRDSGKMSSLNPKGKKYSSIEHYPYGKGFGVARDELVALMALLEVLRKKGMHVILVGHTVVKMFHNPTGDDYDRYWLRLHRDFGGQVKEWVDVLGFCSFDEGGGRLNASDSKSKAWSTGLRLLKLEHTAAFDAKSRIPMPREIELNADDPWGPLQEAIDIGQSIPVKDILLLIKVELERINDPELTINVKKSCKGVRDTSRLSRFLMALKNRKPKTNSTEEEE